MNPKAILSGLLKKMRYFIFCVVYENCFILVIDEFVFLGYLLFLEF